MYTLNSVEVHAVAYEQKKAYAIENHPNDSRVKLAEDDIVQALTSRMGTGGGNVPLVMEKK